jgi:biopolymer transport protein ExbD
MHGRFERRRPIAEMNLIPLIDVSLILVIIFMVLTPVLVHYQMTVRLPTSTEGAPGEAETTIVVQIDRNGRVTVNGRPVDASKLERELVGLLGKSARKTVLVQADRAVSIQKVVSVLDVAKRLKVGKLGIGVAEAK